MHEYKKKIYKSDTKRNFFQLAFVKSRRVETTWNKNLSDQRKQINNTGLWAEYKEDDDDDGDVDTLYT